MATKNTTTATKANKKETIVKTANKSTSTASSAPTLVKVPHLRFGFHADTVERIFAKAQKKGVPVTLYKTTGIVIADAVPLAKTEAGYKVKADRNRIVRAEDVQKIEATY